MRVAYVMSRFPRLTETFVVTEILAVRETGIEVDLFPLLREAADLVQPDARQLVSEAHYQPFVSSAILRANLRMFTRAPRRYVGTLWAVIRMTWRSPNFLVGALATFPKVVRNAQVMETAAITHVHCHFATHPAVAGFVIRRLVRIPFSFTAHGSDLHQDRRGLPTKVAEAAFVVAVSEYNRRIIVNECAGRWSDKVVVIHCGVRTDEFRPHPERDAAKNPFTILCVGTLHEVKGQRYLIEACRRLADWGIEVRCIFIGDG